MSAIPLIFCIHIYNAIYFDIITKNLGFYTKIYSISTQNSLILVVEWFGSAFLKKISELNRDSSSCKGLYKMATTNPKNL